MTRPHLLLVAQLDPTSVGTHLTSAARSMEVDVESIDYAGAYSGPWLLRQLSWRFKGHRPIRLRSFGDTLLERCRTEPPDVMLTTGFAPLSAEIVRRLKSMGTKIAIYLTDDPFSPQRRSPWFLRALELYDFAFSTRKSNLRQLQDLEGPQVEFLPFAFAPGVHYRPERAPEAREAIPEVVFVGGADADRVPYMAALIEQGFDVGLYGGYWHRYEATRNHARGHAEPEKVRTLVRGAKVNPCLVRRSNRDGSSMRTFEVPAMGGCAVMEDTEEHRELFGPDGEAVLYFRSPGDLVEKTRWLLHRPEERERLAARAHALITDNGHTYEDRLEVVLNRVGLHGAPRRPPSD